MDKKDAKHINPDDSTLFREAVRDAQPLNVKHRHQAEKRTTAPKAKSRRNAERQVLNESLTKVTEDIVVEAGERLSFHRPNVNRLVLKKLRRGQLPIQEEIDLHGMSQTEAKTHLQEVLADSLARGYRCIRVVHGKGLRSGSNGPVLKIAVNRWLRQWDDVQAFCSAPANDGGTGAVYVLLSQKR